jgi:CRISPR-associated helicase Cas3/CRISPR-associated endonuclease Cas3-HD
MKIAHVIKSEGYEELQPLFEHLCETQRRCKEFGDEFGNGEFAAECGILHDIGKYSDDFQRRIRGEGKRCDHTTAGARIAFKISIFGKLAAYCIAGHHGGLMDSGTPADVGGEGTLFARLSDGYKTPDYRDCLKEINISNLKFHPKGLKPVSGNGGFTFGFFTHMIYSCLTDSDFLDTEYFMSGRRDRKKPSIEFVALRRKLDQRISMFHTPKDVVNRKRAEILSDCITKAEGERGLYRLSVPTGGGKTLSSMAFAINHVIRNHMNRIVYVIPYTSIIEQNAKVFSDIFGAENILEHHSNYDFNHSEDPQERLKHLATENWDMPIIVTTNIQFFESIFSNKSSKSRKLHNIANSIIVFDEVQMFPVEFMKPCIAAISELVYNYRCSAVLCSATQPALEKFFPPQLKIHDICENSNELFRFFERTQIKYIEEVNSNQLAWRAMGENQCLIIVNTRKHAKKVFNLLQGEGNFHLSTLMCPTHRKEIIQKIKQRLAQNKTCRVISTRLIEAGVDVDFPVVYRAISGLDSIIQSAGRCNREGKLHDESGRDIKGIVYIFNPEEEFYKKMPPSLKLPIEITKEIIQRHENYLRPQAVTDYFNQLYYNKGEEGLDQMGIMKQFDRGVPAGKPDSIFTFNYNFRQIARDFKLIGDDSYSVIIPYDYEALKLLAKIDYVETLKGTLRSLQLYTVNIYRNEFDMLNSAGKLKVIAEDTAILRSIDDYHEHTGIDIDIKLGMGLFL